MRQVETKIIKPAGKQRFRTQYARAFREVGSSRWVVAYLLGGTTRQAAAQSDYLADFKLLRAAVDDAFGDGNWVWSDE